MNKLKPLEVKGAPIRSGPEADMLEQAAKTRFFFQDKEPPVYFYEPLLPTGVPDLVVVYVTRRGRPVKARRNALTPRELRILHHLYSNGGNDIDRIARLLSMPRRQLESALQVLSAANLVSYDSKLIAPVPLSKSFFIKDIIAVEAKINNWRKALLQAAANRWFASRSYILLPEIRSSGRLIEEAREYGIGVLSFSHGGTTVFAEARRQPIPSSYGSWLFNEWTHQVLEHHD